MTEKSLLLKNALVLATMDDARREIADGAVLVKGRQIMAVGTTAEVMAGLERTADETIDLSGHVLLPGLVNTHHHMFQSLTRATPGGQDAELFGWLTAHYPIWSHITPEMIRISAMTAMAELAPHPFSPVKSFNSCGFLGLCCHFHEGKTPWTTSFPVCR